MPLCFRSFLSALVATALLTANAQAQFTITDLGTLGGTSSSANDINARGDVVGVAKDTNGADRAFVWTPGFLILPLTDLGGTSSTANAINSSGWVVGSAAAPTSGNPQHAIRWVSGVAIEITGFGGPTSVAHAINDLEEIVGSGDTNPTFGNPHGFLWRSGVLTDLGTLGGTLSAGFGINNATVVVGTGLVSGGATTRAFRWVGSGPMQDLGTLATGTRSVARSVNTGGAVVGYSNITSGGVEDHPFLRAAGSSTLVDLGTFGGNAGEAHDVNDFGLVVGWANDAGGQRRAFSSTGSGLTDLNTLLPGGSGWVLEEAHAVNDGGQIVGVGTHLGQSRAFLLSPASITSAPGRASNVAFAGASPNPVRERTLFAFTLSQPGTASLAIYDLGGRRIRQLVEGARDAGAQIAEWDARDDAGARVAPGLYFARLLASRADAQMRRVTVVQ